MCELARVTHLSNCLRAAAVSNSIARLINWIVWQFICICILFVCIHIFASFHPVHSPQCSHRGVCRHPNRPIFEPHTTAFLPKTKLGKSHNRRAFNRWGTRIVCYLELATMLNYLHIFFHSFANRLMPKLRNGEFENSIGARTMC